MANELPRLALCAALGCGLLSPCAASAQEEPEIKELALGFGLDLPFAVHVVAIEKGWFEEAGFEEVTTRTFTAGALAGEALVAGEIHLWTPGNLPPISMVHNAIPVVVLGIDSINLGLDKLVVRKDANVTEPEDLYGMKIGLLEGSTASLDLANLIAHYGLDAGRIQVVNLAPPEQLASLIAGDVQALLAWEPWRTGRCRRPTPRSCTRAWSATSTPTRASRCRSRTTARSSSPARISCATTRTP
jgi:ABC-type nitrate/sulfonate/bicarbonate transport system substrate-binding protein